MATIQERTLNHLHRLGYNHAELLDHGATVGLAVEVPEGRFAARHRRNFDWTKTDPTTAATDLINHVNRQIDEARRGR